MQTLQGYTRSSLRGRTLLYLPRLHSSHLQRKGILQRNKATAPSEPPRCKVWCLFKILWFIGPGPRQVILHPVLILSVLDLRFNLFLYTTHFGPAVQWQNSWTGYLNASPNTPHSYSTVSVRHVIWNFTSKLAPVCTSAQGGCGSFFKIGNHLTLHRSDTRLEIC